MGKPDRRSVFLSRFSVGLVFLAFIELSCGPDQGESPTRGNLVVLTAESVAPVLAKVTAEFNKLYPNAHVSLAVTTSREAIVKLLNDEAKVIVTARELNSEEHSIVGKYGLHVDSFRVAYDGIGVIVHPTNPIDQISVEELRQITTGKIKTWKELIPSGRKSPEIFIAMGGPNTSAYEVFKTRVVKGESFTEQLYPCSTSTQVLDLVRERPEAIGFVGTGWLAGDSSGTKVLEVGSEEYQTDALGRQVKYFSPHPAHIYRGFYPLRRTIYLYSREKGFGLGAGFGAFVTSGPGQKIFLDNGLVPAAQQVRLSQPTSKTS